MSLSELFTNKKKTEDKEVEISAPAFSFTKVGAGIGVVILAVLAAVPKALKNDETIVVAAVAAGTLITLGIFALIAVDIRTRQRAREASLRFGDGEKKEAGTSFHALPDDDTLVLQKDHNKDEFELKLAMVEDGEVTLLGRREGESLTPVFRKVTTPK